MRGWLCFVVVAALAVGCGTGPQPETGSDPVLGPVGGEQAERVAREKYPDVSHWVVIHDATYRDVHGEQQPTWIVQAAGAGPNVRVLVTEQTGEPYRVLESPASIPALGHPVLGRLTLHEQRVQERPQIGLVYTLPDSARIEVVAGNTDHVRLLRESVDPEVGPAPEVIDLQREEENLWSYVWDERVAEVARLTVIGALPEGAPATEVGLTLDDTEWIFLGSVLIETE